MTIRHCRSRGAKASVTRGIASNAAALDDIRLLDRRITLDHLFEYCKDLRRVNLLLIWDGPFVVARLIG
jgi:hypothetical protein